MSIFEMRQQGLGQFVLTTQHLLQKRSRCPVRRITSSTNSSDHLGPLLIGVFSQLDAYVVEGVSILDGEAVTTNRSRHLLLIKATAKPNDPNKKLEAMIKLIQNGYPLQK